MKRLPREGFFVLGSGVHMVSTMGTKAVRRAAVVATIGDGAAFSKGRDFGA